MKLGESLKDTAKREVQEENRTSHYGFIVTRWFFTY
ncbi:hypothetical protein [Lysinibacillus macroides]